jgi:hypothetical protein
MATANTATQTVYNEITQQVFDPSAGPAADLYKSKYTVSSNYSLSFPKDLESSRKGHAVYFEIYEINPVSLAETLKPFGFNLDAPATAPVTQENGGPTVTNPDQVTTEALKAGTKSFFERVTSPTAVNIAPRTKENAVATIALYMPETLNFAYDASYNSLTTLSSALNSTPITSLGGLTNAITSIAENSAVKLAMSAAGYVFNPQQQVLFDGITFREYEMNFTFTPTSAEETRNVNAIIKTLRFHAAPQIGGVGGFFFIPPSVFNVSFRYNGKVNPNINLLKKSVLKNVNVNYAPNGWAAFEGSGAPVQTTMTLQFQEIVLVDKTQINQGF